MLKNLGGHSWLFQK